MSLITNLKLKYKLASISEKLIFINVGVFAIIALFRALVYSFQKTYLDFFDNYFALPEDLNVLVFKPWTIFSYMFLHAGFYHLLFNMIVLYFSGKIFLNFFSTRRLLNYYFLGGIAGGLTFVILYNVLPGFKDDHQILVGASAAIFAIMVGVTAEAPNYSVKLFGLFDLKLWVITIFAIISFIALIPGPNSGGEFAHLGGAFLGYFYTKQLQKGKDIGKGFEKLMNSISALFKPKSRSNLKTVHKSKKGKVAGHTKQEFNEFNNQKKIDLILDKISKSGYESLTKEEKEFLFKAGKNQR